MMNEQLAKLEINLIEKIITGQRQFRINNIKNINEENISFMRTIFYSILIITTIGLGKLKFKSIMAQIYLIIYIIVGVPLMINCVTNFADLFFKIILKAFLSLLFRKRRDNTHHLREKYEVMNKQYPLAAMKSLSNENSRFKHYCMNERSTYQLINMSSAKRLAHNLDNISEIDDDNDDEDNNHLQNVNNTPSRMPLIKNENNYYKQLNNKFRDTYDSIENKSDNNNNDHLELVPLINMSIIFFVVLYLNIGVLLFKSHNGNYWEKLLTSIQLMLTITYNDDGIVLNKNFIFLHTPNIYFGFFSFYIFLNLILFSVMLNFFKNFFIQKFNKYFS